MSMCFPSARWRLPPRPVLAFEVGIAVELVAQASVVRGFICGGLDTQGLVHLGHQTLHPLASGDDDATLGGRVWLHHPTDR